MALAEVLELGKVLWNETEMRSCAGWVPAEAKGLVLGGREWRFCAGGGGEGGRGHVGVGTDGEC